MPESSEVATDTASEVNKAFLDRGESDFLSDLMLLFGAFASSRSSCPSSNESGNMCSSTPSPSESPSFTSLLLLAFTPPFFHLAILLKKEDLKNCTCINVSEKKPISYLFFDDKAVDGWFGSILSKSWH